MEKTKTAKTVIITRVEARALLAALDWCECSFKLGKSQQSVKQKIFEIWPDLALQDLQLLAGLKG